jgi:hypothetical protein
MMKMRAKACRMAGQKLETARASEDSTDTSAGLILFIEEISKAPPGLSHP